MSRSRPSTASPPFARRAAAGVVAGIGRILAAFFFPAFLLKLGVFLAGLGLLGSTLLRRLLGPERARKLILNLALAGAVFALVLVLGEFAVRVVLTDVTTTPDNGSYFALRWQRGLKENSLGFREREIPAEPRTASTGSPLSAIPSHGVRASPGRSGFRNSCKRY